MTKRALAPFILGCSILLGCSVTPTDGGPNESTGTKQAADAPKPVTTPERAVGDVNERIAETAQLVSTALGKNPELKSDEKIRVAYNRVYVSANAYVNTVADLLVVNRWDKDEVEKRANDLSVAMTQLRALVEPGSGNDLASAGKIAKFLVDLGFSIYDGYRNRKDAERKEFAELFRNKAKAWNTWETIVAQKKEVE